MAVSNEIATRLELNPMVSSNNSQYETAFTVSVDAASALTGISAAERDMTIQILANPLSKPQELARPGHIFPLRARDGGVMVRVGQTEGSVDLARLGEEAGRRLQTRSGFMFQDAALWANTNLEGNLLIYKVSGMVAQALPGIANIPSILIQR